MLVRLRATYEKESTFTENLKKSLTCAIRKHCVQFFNLIFPKYIPTKLSLIIWVFLIEYLRSE